MKKVFCNCAATTVYLFFFLNNTAMAATYFDTFPDSLQEDEKYILYLHGRIIEDKGTRPTHPTFGIYEYDEIVKGFMDGGYNVIGEVRKPNTNPREYANYVSEQIRRYMAQGKGEVNVVGFSKGAVISLLVSAQLSYPEIRYAILAGCWTSVTEQDLQLSGQVLSMYDVSDSVSSCQPLADKSKKISEFHERTFDTGKSHGLFFQPYPVWLEPLLTWLKSTK